MSHEITSTDTFLFNKPAWHGLGTVLDRSFTIDEAIAQAGLDWTVSLEPIQVSSSAVPVEGYRAVVREGIAEPLAVVGADYTPYQNHAMLEDVRQAASAVGRDNVYLHSAGSLRGGRTVVVCVALGEGEVAKGDLVRQYGIVTNGHDGKQSVRVWAANERVVCANTERIALMEGVANRTMTSRRHTSGLIVDVPLLMSRILMACDAAEMDMRQARLMAEIEARDEVFGRIYKHLYGKPETDAQKAKATTILSEWAALRRSPITRLGNEADGSLWEAYNAVTAWVDHKRGKVQERAASNLLGSGADLKVKVRSFLLSEFGM
jgi:phage/plasmid-like protein (TIGR03299 family)